VSIISRSIASIGYSQGPRSVSSIGYLANQQDGKSGYWRLFYYQMQEAELNKSKEKPVEQKPKIVVKKKVTKSKDQHKPVEKRVEPEEPEDFYPPFKPIEPFKRLEDQPNYFVQSWLVVQEIQSWVFSYSQNTLKFNEIQAANDEEAVELLLLLA
jgi:hypothetical protein